MTLSKGFRLAWVLVTLAACVTEARDEVARVSSPSRRVEAVLIQTNGGATTSFGYEVHVVEPGRKASRGREVAYLYGATRSATASGANLKWLSANELIVEYESARITRLQQPSVDIAGQRIRVLLRPGFADPSRASR